MTTLEWAKLAADVGILPVIGMVGWLVRRAVAQVDGRFTSMDSKLTDIDKKLDHNVAETNGLKETVAVMKFRLQAIDGKVQ